MNKKPRFEVLLEQNFDIVYFHYICILFGPEVHREKIYDFLQYLIKSRHGVKNSVKIVAKIKPPEIVVASCVHHCVAGAPYVIERSKKFNVMLVDIGNKPKTAVAAVKMIGRILCAPARTMDSPELYPSFCRW